MQGADKLLRAPHDLVRVDADAAQQLDADAALVDEDGKKDVLGARNGVQPVALVERKFAREIERPLGAGREPVDGQVMIEVTAKALAVLFDARTRGDQKAARRAVRDTHHGKQDVLRSDIVGVIVLCCFLRKADRLLKVIGKMRSIQTRISFQTSSSRIPRTALPTYSAR